ncbi:Serine/threonine-protein kinase AfsK [Adhaeretor mobilis]|uniref:Serine/threonine-protein kinase AfsK n=2 Tax=Adhaeretor mobilis TaxID=1930276 RepID=A0A517MR51_9BACT|nr:Serine/threonine-protein kinase AfsK [Adhaeretor mobilis]
MSLVTLACLSASTQYVYAGPLIPRPAASQVGLERAWFAQIGTDPARSEVTAWTLHDDCLFGVTDSGTAFALDANTGARLWVRQVGKQGYRAFGPGANSRFVAIVSGAKLYLLNRDDGRLMWSRDLGSAPGAGPAITEDYAFVVMLTGRVEGYDLNDPDARPWYYNSRGRAYLRPVTTGEVVSWPTSAGLLYVSSATKLGLLYRLETNDEIVAPPAEMDGNLYIASLDGYLYSIDGLTGNENWRFATGYPVETAPAVVGKRVYVSSSEPAIHAVDTKSGRELWDIAGSNIFVAQGKSRVYAADSRGSLQILDTETGSILGTLNTAEGIYPLVNEQTDRIYLVNRHGLVQCLHEIGADKPLRHRSMAKAKLKKEDDSDVNPFGEETPVEAGEGNAFDEALEAGPAEETPAEERADEADQGENNLFDDLDFFE